MNVFGGNPTDFFFELETDESSAQWATKNFKHDSSQDNFSALTFPSTVPLKFFLPFALFFFRLWHLTVTTTTTQVKQKQDNQVHK